jgi:hypothetical protein
MSARPAAAGVGLAVAGGLVLAGGTTAAWVRQAADRDVGGVRVADQVTLPGTAFAGWLVGVGLAAVLGGLALLLPSTRLRSAVAAGLTLLGAGGLAGVAAGALRAGAGVGSLAAGPGVAAIGALAVLLGGGMALRRPAARPRLPARYDLEADEGDEWHRASVEPEHNG